MSYGDYDDSMDRYDEWIAELYVEHVEEFTLERLKSYYIENPALAEEPLRALSEARSLFYKHAAASIIFSAIAIGTGLKLVLIKPIVFGLVHSEAAANIITELTITHTGLDRYKTLIFKILLDYGTIDFGSYVREGSSKTLWEEINDVQKMRNAIAHRAQLAIVRRDDAETAIAVASALLEDIFPKVINYLELHLHEDYVICGNKYCKMKKIETRGG